MRACAAIALAMTAATGCLVAPASWLAAEPAGAARYGPARTVCFLANQAIGESSGLAASRRNAAVFWTHNDSGDGPRLFAFNAAGKDLGTFTVAGAKNRDWEDIASFSVGKRHYLLVADTGDNDRERPFVTLYLLPEPAVDPSKPAANGTIEGALAIDFTFQDGPQDCEAVGVDPTSRTAYLVAKRGRSTVYELPLPTGVTPGRKLLARPIARLSLLMPVAMDISPDGLRAVVLTYGPACEYTRKPGETWAAAFARSGRALPMPGRRQGESICYGPDGRTLYLTSEKLPTPLLEVPAAAAAP